MADTKVDLSITGTTNPTGDIEAQELYSAFSEVTE